MRSQYAGIIKNDVAAAPGISVTFFAQGCPHKCPECHNPETWPFTGGQPFSEKVLYELEEAIYANGITRNLCIMGGEPLCPENSLMTYQIVNWFKGYHPEVKIYIWSGYYLQELKDMHITAIDEVLSKADYLIDGPYLKDLRDITLPMRGSWNQHIIPLT